MMILYSNLMNFADNYVLMKLTLLYKLEDINEKLCKSQCVYSKCLSI